MGPNELRHNKDGSWSIVSPCGNGCGPHWDADEALRIAESWRCFACQGYR